MCRQQWRHPSHICTVIITVIIGITIAGTINAGIDVIGIQFLFKQETGARLTKLHYPPSTRASWPRRAGIWARVILRVVAASRGVPRRSVRGCAKLAMPVSSLCARSTICTTASRRGRTSAPWPCCDTISESLPVSRHAVCFFFPAITDIEWRTAFILCIVFLVLGSPCRGCRTPRSLARWRDRRRGNRLLHDRGALRLSSRWP